MKQILFILTTVLFSASIQAGITTYTFTNEQWHSKQGSTVMDNTTDGWTSDKAGESYITTTNPNFQNGVKVTANATYTGAGATSIKSFTNVRRITLNYATTTKGKGSFNIQVGTNTAIDTAVTIGEANHELTITLPEAQTGQITFKVNCTRNSIYLYQIAIRSEDGLSPVFTQSTFQLVTDISQLQDSDQIIFGVADGTTNKIMGYYDESVSQNNIHAINGKYSTSRDMVAANDNAIYTLWITEDPATNRTQYIFQDELRYEQAFLVADGGRTKNKLTLWTDVVSSAYGNNGYWSMTIALDGTAVIENLGTSERKYMQYNASDKLFGCYADPNSQTKVCIYREVPAPPATEPAISAPMINFGDIVLPNNSTGNKTIEVNAMNLTADITATLKHGDAFSLNNNQSPITNHQSAILDRDGDNLTISYSVTQAGRYIDTLVLTSGSTTVEVTVMLNAIRELTIAEAVHSAEFDLVYLNPVVVTKKYDKYIFVRDDTGSMIIFNSTNPATDKPYGQGLEQGHQLSGVIGRFVNYYGVPELRPTAAWSVAPQKVTVLPEEQTTPIDSADVCRYISIPNATISDNTLSTNHKSKIKNYKLSDPFNVGIPSGTFSHVEAIVMISWDELQLWFIKADAATPLDEVNEDKSQMSIPSDRADRQRNLKSQIYNLLGQPVTPNYRGIIIRNGIKVLNAND